jgi:transposase
MIQITPQTKILLCIAAVDFRRGIDGLAQLCRTELASEPFSGAVFVFRNRRGTALKLLTYDGQGYWILHKRLSEGRFSWWPDNAGKAARSLAVHELQLLLWNGNPDKAATQPFWRRINTAG